MNIEEFHVAGLDFTSFSVPYFDSFKASGNALSCSFIRPSFPLYKI
jgi:hypothetical protein